ncbi:Acetyltransferase (GNAT) family protein [Pseudooceanicola antarcticus]|uniref:Acetyltransferase (GNAT) family protein n=2 Tax=Pseudooceanicola antarcticus TaxID=1247613 RepID=A0A285HPR2_9RHOB|nr:Acetyltransferase (GNAT) family protein [Pseudooceanicola antarcticus]
MAMTEIRPYAPDHRDAVLDLVLRAWQDIMPRTRDAVPGFVYDNFYPEGWQVRQRRDVAALLEDDPAASWVALKDDLPVGILCLRAHPEDRMGEIHLLAVDPAHQRQGIGTALMARAEEILRDLGLQMVMVETVGDSGHAPARKAYEGQGFKPWPVARYFKKL